MSPSTDWIDNAGLNIALRQGRRGKLFLEDVYRPATETLRYLGWMTKWNHKEGADCNNRNRDCFFLCLSRSRESRDCVTFRPDRHQSAFGPSD